MSRDASEDPVEPGLGPSRIELDDAALREGWQGLLELEAEEAYRVLVGPEDPLGLARLSERYLDDEGLLLDVDEVVEAAAFRLAVDLQGSGDVAPGEWVRVAIVAGTDAVQARIRAEELRGAALPDPLPLHLFSLQAYFGVPREHLRKALIEFHALDRRLRHGLLHVVLMRKGYDGYERETGIPGDAARRLLAEGLTELARALRTPEPPPEGDGA